MSRLLVAALAGAALTFATTAGADPTPEPIPRPVTPAPTAATPAAPPAAAPPPAAPPAAAPPARGQPAVAQGWPRWNRAATLVFDMGFDFGSTELAEMSFSDGSSSTLKANQGFWMSMGLAFLKLDAGPVSVETAATLGFKYRSIGADNGAVRYLAFPLEVVERAYLGPFRLGVGASIALNPSIKGSDDFDVPELDIGFKSSLGFLFRAEFIGDRRGFRDQGWFVGMRYVWQKLEAEEVGLPFKANTFGLTAGVEF